MTGTPPRHAMLLAALGLLATGCGLPAELDREADPERTAAQQGPAPFVPPATRPEAVHTPPSGTTPTDPACPATGIRVWSGMVNAAMGLRAMPVTITNCGTADHKVEGYPDVRVRDVDRKPMDVTVLKGTGPIATVEDPGPRPVTLKPGESARSVFAWRYSAVDPTTRDGSGVYVEIAPAPGVARQTVVPEGGLDIGDTGLLGTTAWEKVVE
ncbi:DUF4232 domain-containing protein [Streptomyces sp. HUAS MG47]|uniref:DUF4232 domain-containing protein n=1 Tax=Streptomyces solicamelliae TaxID=3231716 RepID=UPI003877BBD5